MRRDPRESFDVPDADSIAHVERRLAQALYFVDESRSRERAKIAVKNEVTIGANAFPVLLHILFAQKPDAVHVLHDGFIKDEVIRINDDGRTLLAHLLSEVQEWIPQRTSEEDHHLRVDLLVQQRFEAIAAYHVHAPPESTH